MSEWSLLFITAGELGQLVPEVVGLDLFYQF
jgi:hypothetical protein